MVEEQAAQGLARVLIISHDVVGRRMAGPGIRYWEMARVLAARQPVTLIAPRTIDLEAVGVTTGSYTWGEPDSLAPFLRDAGIVVANGYVLLPHPELAGIRQPLALDLYDPTLLENLELFREAPDEQRLAQNRQDTGILARQLSAGDFFLCATERQRDLYLGALMAAGRITPHRIDGDPVLRNLIDVVPFGLPSAEPVRQHAVLRGVIPGIDAEDIIVLWTGGLWDWLDPLTLVQAMPRVVACHPRTRLVFLSGQHPGDAAPMRMPEATKAQAAALGLLDRHIIFHEQWIPYTQRADFLLDADIAVSLHRNGLETAYAAVRSRFLDHLWAGLPSVVSEGDAAAELVQRHGLGRVVKPGDAEELATAILALIEDHDERRACAVRARHLAATFIWERCITPLALWCSAGGQKDQSALAAAVQAELPKDDAVPPEAPVAADDDLSDAVTTRHVALAALDKHWHVDEPKPRMGLLALLRYFVIRQFVRPFVWPLLEQQNAYNAASAKAFYALSETSDRQQSLLQQAIDQTRQLETRFSGQEARVDALELSVRPLQARVDALELSVRPLQARVDALELSVRPLQARVDALEGATREANRQIAALQQHALDLDDADTTLAELLLIEATGARDKTNGPV